MRVSGALLVASPSQLHPSHLSAHELLERGGYLRRSGRGLFILMPMGMQAIRMISLHIHREMKGLGGHEVLMPLMAEEETWDRTGRIRLAQGEVFKFTDRSGHRLVLSPTHEQTALVMFQSTVSCTDQLPVFLYQTQLKAREDDGENLEIDRAREFIMHDGFSLHPSFASLNNFVPRVYQAFQRIFAGLGITPIVADGLANHMRSDRSYDFFLEHREGDFGLVHCSNCGYVANQDVASGSHSTGNETPLPLQTLVRLDMGSMDELAKELGIPKQRMARAKLYWGFDQAILAVYRADQEPSPEKVGRICSDTVIREANEQEIRRLGLLPGFLSPFGLRNRRLQQKKLKVVVDRLVAESANLILPVNEEHSYVINTNFGRDYDADFSGDISRISEDFSCRNCGTDLSSTRALRLATITRLGDYFSRAMEYTVRSPEGLAVHPFLGAYGIDLGRVLVAMVESNRSRRGFLWPLHFSPCKAYLVHVGTSPRVEDLASQIHDELQDLVLFDDEAKPFLAKIKHADTLGIKLRIVISRSSLDNRKARVMNAATAECSSIPLDSLRPFLMEQARLEHGQEGI